MKHVKLKEWKAECPSCHHIEMDEKSNSKCGNCSSPVKMTYESQPSKNQTRNFIEDRQAGIGRRIECSQECGWYVYEINCSKCNAVITRKFFKGKESVVMHCFVATSAFNDIDHPVVESLRNFRDEKLQLSRAGQRFIKVYYKNGAAWGRWLDKMPYFKPLVRFFLIGFVNLRKRFN